MNETDRKCIACGTVLVTLGFIPIWRCGLRYNLNFYQFAKEHTIWGHEVVYIPVEEMTSAPEIQARKIQWAMKREAIC